MGKIKKLQDKGATILPLTVADAVLMNSTEAGNLSTYLEGLKRGVDFLLSIIGEDQAGDIFLKTKDGMPRGFYTEGFVSAGGKPTTEGGGSGGANLTQMWESLQTNNDTFKDSLINVAHIPTLTTGKISDFVSATQAIADTAVANKADKDKVVDLTSNQTISGEKSFKMFYGNSSFNILNNVNSVIINYSETGGWDGGYMIKSGDKTMTTFGVHGSTRKPFYAYVSLNGEVGNTNPSFKFYEGGKLTHKTLDVQESAHTNLVTNLNADRLDGLHASDFAKYSGSSEVDSVKYPSIGYGSSSNGAKGSGAIITAVRSSGDYGGQFNGDYNAQFLCYRGLNKGVWTEWKQLAFTEDVLPRTGGTLTGALTVNAPINNTGALKLLGASEVSSTGMAVGSYARAVGSNSTALSSQSRAGLKSTDDSNVELYGYKSLPINVDGNVVYGFELPGGETKTFTYSGAEYSVTNPDSKQLGTVFLVPIDSSFIATSVSPYNRCAVVKANGVSRGLNPYLNKVEKISDSVAILCVYNSVTKVTSNDYSGEYTIYTLRKTSDTQKSGSYTLAIGNNALAIGANSRSLQYYSVASGYQSLSAGMFSAAIGSRSIALGSMSLAIGTDSIAVGLNSVAYGNDSLALGHYTVTRKNYQTVIGYLNEEDTSNIFVIGAGSTETSRKNVFTVSPSGNVSMGNQLRIGVGGKNEVYLHSDVADQLYIHTSAGIPFLIQGDFIRRGSSAPKTTLGTDQYKWFNVFTEALKIADANLTYDTGTLTIDKALKTTSTLTATQGEFANSIKIGNATISWNPKGYLVIDEGLASHKFISAGGVVTGDAGGGAGGIEESSTIAELRQRVAQLEAQLISLTSKE